MSINRIAVALAALMAWSCVGTPRVQAMMAPSQTVAAAAMSDRASDLQTVRGALENRVVRQRLADMGLTPEQIDGRLNRLDDQKLHQVAMRIEKQNPAGDATGLVLTVLLLAIVVGLIVWIIDAVED